MVHYDINRLRELPIEDVAERLGLQVGRGHKALCPFHDDTHPSLSFHRGRNSFHCFVCGTGGSGPIDLVMKVLGKSFAEACQWLAGEHGILPSPAAPRPHRLHSRSAATATGLAPDLPYLESLVARPVLNAPAHRFLFEERRISPPVAALLGISSTDRPVPMSRDLRGPYFNAPSLLIPYRDLQGRLAGLQARYLGQPSPGCPAPPPRFQFPRGSTCSVFNLPVLGSLARGEPLFITEGVTDCMAMLSSGHKAIAIPSATLLRPSHMDMLRSVLSQTGSVPHIVPDRDQPGERLYLDLREHLPQLVRHQLPEGYKDYGQWWASHAR